MPKRKFYLRIEEPLSIPLERCAELLGTTGIDHSVKQALEFVFRKDRDFKERLSHNPQPAPRRPPGQRKKTKSVQNSDSTRHGSPQEPEPLAEHSL
jgi:hypothetical protein